MLPESDLKSAPKSANDNPTQPAAPTDWPSPPAVTIPTDPAFDEPRDPQPPTNMFRIDSDGMSPDDDPFNDEPLLTLVELNASEQLFAPFTPGRQDLWLHYRNSDPYRGYLHCLGDSCPLCLVGQSKSKMLIYPVYDPIARAVRLLPITENERPGKLMPQFREPLRRVMNRERLLVGLSKINTWDYALNVYPWTTDLKEADEVIARFARAVESRTARTAPLYTQMTAASLASLPDVAQMMRLRGLSL